MADLVDALVDRGHRVTLIGAGRHHTMAQRFLATDQRQPTDQLGEALPEVVHTAKVARLLADLDVGDEPEERAGRPVTRHGRSIGSRAA